jgi:hypothetical protein
MIVICKQFDLIMQFNKKFTNMQLWLYIICKLMLTDTANILEHKNIFFKTI